MISQKMCLVCVMDTSDPEIEFFGEEGCNHCKKMLEAKWVDWFPQEKLHPKMQALIDKIKIEGKNKEYDCILGLSGGLDSSYLALKAYEWGLRPLVLHVDAGWNSELAVRNIQSILDYTSWDLHTVVIDWEIMRKLQIAYLKSGISNQDVPQDHSFFTNLLLYAKHNDIKWILNGGNYSSEGIFASSWHGVSSMDSKNLNAIYRKFGQGKLEKYKKTSFFNLYFYYPKILKIRSIRPLNYLKYNLEAAKIELKEKTGWQDYPRKHGESLFTRFFQDYYLIKRCKIDKRKAHYSSLIISQQISREAALELLKKETFSESQISREVNFISRKLQISEQELRKMIAQPVYDALQLPNWMGQLKILKNISQYLKSKTL